MTSTLSADRPQTDPAHDLFGYAPFAKTLTKAIYNHRASDPLVLGLYGAWGSGKSTILKFICHYLKAVPESDRPIVIEFNPWWFSGQEHLAKAFLGQFRAVLSKKDNTFQKLGVLLGNYSESIGSVIDAVAPTGGFGKKLGSLIKTVYRRPPQDVAALKAEICDKLQQSKKHIVIMVDDIDRLEVEEIRQLFTVIKALADFPNVTYLLAFDQHVVVRAIETYSGMPGQAYLEKIIQASFVVPQVDRTVLLNGLGKRLDDILKGTPEYLFEQRRWNSFFYNGFNNFFTVPRDIVRFCNTLSVTYPAMRGEVNAVDFIVIEAIRVFLPKLYMYMRENQHEFVGIQHMKKISDQELNNILDNFVPNDMRQSMKKILILLFPYFVNDSSVYNSSARRALLIGNPEVFPCYFRFNPPLNTISNSEIMQWLENAGDTDTFASVLLQAREQGLLRVRMYLDRLRDHIKEDIKKNDIPVVINVLLDISDKLIESPDDIPICSISTNLTLIIYNINLLASCLPPNQRMDVLEHAVQNGCALVAQCLILRDSEKVIESGRESLIPQEELKKFRTLLLAKIDESILNKTLECHQNLRYILKAWSYWSVDTSRIKDWCTEVTLSNGGMFAFMKKFIYTMQHEMTDVTITYHINPKEMEPYIDIIDFERRILALQADGNIPSEDKETATLFLQGVAKWREGKNPEDFF